MSTGKEVTKSEVERLSPFQRELHITDGKETKVHPEFSRKFRLTSHVAGNLAEIKPLSNENTHTYSIDLSLGYLRSLSMSRRWPAIAVKEKFKDKIRICYPHNLGFAYIIKGEMIVNEQSPMQTIDRDWLAEHAQFWRDPNYRDGYDRGVGNLPFLETWTSKLPSFTTTILHPWYILRSHGDAFPLFMLDNSTGSVKFVYRTIDNIKDILRMQAYDDKTGSWINIDCNLKCLDGVGNGKLPTPSVTIRYAFATDDEIKWRRKEYESKPLIHYYQDIVPLSSKPGTYGETLSVDISCERPCQAIFWVAENQNATQYNNFTNYSTNSDNLADGYDPIRSVSLMYGTKAKFENVENQQFSIIEPELTMRSSSYEPGYACFSNSLDPLAYDPHSSVVYSSTLKPEFTAKLENTDPFLIKIQDDNEEDDDIVEELVKKQKNPIDPNGPKFILRVHLLVIRKMTMIYNKEKKSFNVQLD